MTTTEKVLPVPVLIVEDELIIQVRLKQILCQIGYNEDALFCASSVCQALDLIDAQEYSLALIDLGLPDGSGISVIDKLRELELSIPILVVSAWSTQASLFTAIKAGATGYVLKERDDTEVALSIRSILRGGAPIDPFIAREILKQIATDSAIQTASPESGNVEPSILTAREKEILCLVAQGMSNREIALHLNVSRYTVESHIKHIYRKLAVTKRTKAVSTARSMGIL